jgi:hypothetical protein
LDNQDVYEKVCQLGRYFVEWKRKRILDLNRTGNQDDDNDVDDDTICCDDDEPKPGDEFFVNLKISLPEINVRLLPFYIENILPPYGCLNTSFTVVNQIKNNTDKRLNLECAIDDNDAFSLSGNKLVS